MEQKLSKKIIKQAIIAFNNQGILSTSLRQIAQELNISDGHLRYYFNTKEDLIIAVYQEMLMQIENFRNAIPNDLQMWEKIIFKIKGLFSIQSRFSWLYSESVWLFKKYPRLKKIHEEIKQMQRQRFQTENQENIRLGIFTKSLTTTKLVLIQEQFMILIDSWIPYYKIQAKDSGLLEDKVINHYVSVTISSFLPYLNEKLQKDIELWISDNVIISD